MGDPRTGCLCVTRRCLLASASVCLRTLLLCRAPLLYSAVDLLDLQHLAPSGSCPIFLCREQGCSPHPAMFCLIMSPECLEGRSGGAASAQPICKRERGALFRRRSPGRGLGYLARAREQRGGRSRKERLAFGVRSFLERSLSSPGITC